MTNFLVGTLTSALFAGHSVAFFSAQHQAAHFKSLVIEEKQRWLAGLAANKKFRLFHRKVMSIDFIRSRVEGLIAQGGLDLVAVDYAQIISSSTLAADPVRKNTEVSSALVQIARDFGVPVLVTAQLTLPRNPAIKDPRPYLLRYLGSFESECSQIMFLSHHPLQTVGRLFGDELDVRIAKNCFGSLCDIRIPRAALIAGPTGLWLPMDHDKSFRCDVLRHKAQWS